MINSFFSVDDYLKYVKKLIDDEMQSLMLHNNSLLSEAMKYSLFAGGKRLRPALIIAVAEIYKIPVEKIIPACCAVEMIHTYSLIHDDLPCMDNDDFRRGKPSLHKAFGEDIALLAGDALLTYAFEVICNTKCEARNLLKIIKLLSNASGMSGMIGGQYMDITASSLEVPIDLEKMHSLKTGALFRACVLIPLYTISSNTSDIDALEKYAYYFGLIFQMRDDYLDYFGDENKIGKKNGSDAENNKITFISVLGADKTLNLIEKYGHNALDCLTSLNKKAYLLDGLVKYIMNREN